MRWSVPVLSEPWRKGRCREKDRSQMSEDRGQRTEVRGQRSEVRGQRSEVRGQRSEDRSQKTEVSPAAGQKNGQSDRKRNFWDSVPKSAVVGFRISQKTPAKCRLVRRRRRNPTKPGVGSTQPTKVKCPRMEPTPTFEM